METTITAIKARLGGKKKKIILISVLVPMVMGLALVAVRYAVIGKGEKATSAVAMSNERENITTSGLVATVGDEPTLGSKEVGSSWPGEIISSELAQIQPQRQGVITDWRVHVGDTVSAGDILGKISAPPATPELIKMLAEQAEAVARAKAGVSIADEFSAKERARLDGLKSALESDTVSPSGVSFTVLRRMREKVEASRITLRSFIERTVASQVTTVSTVTDYRYVQPGRMNQLYGSLNQDVQNAYESALISLAGKLKSGADIPIEEAQEYFTLAVRLANSSGNGDEVNAFKAKVAEDQKDFLEVLADFREARIELADKETEYKLMISEKGAMVEKDRALARAESSAAEASFATVSKEVNNGSYIIAPRAGTVSAIYKKVGELVLPEMPIAVVAGYGEGRLLVRMRIPGNIPRPAKGDLVSVMRPGFPSDTHQAKLMGIGASLDETGSYMADAVLTDLVDWPSGASVRVIAPSSLAVPVVAYSSVWWSVGGLPHVWGVSEAGRIFAKKITIGRTLGASVEVYDGMKNGDRYIVVPAPSIRENMLLGDILTIPEKTDTTKTSPEKSSGHESMPGMEM